MDLQPNSAIEKAIAQHLATGRYASAEEVVLTALERLEADDSQYLTTIESLQRSLADEEAGRLTPLSKAVDDIRGKHGIRAPQ